MTPSKAAQNTKLTQYVFKLLVMKTKCAFHPAAFQFYLFLLSLEKGSKLPQG